MSEVELVEVAQPEDNEKNERCSQTLDEVGSTRNGFNIGIFLKRNAFVILTMAAVAFGIGLGFALRHINMSEREITYLTFPGDLLLRMLQMMVLPLVVLTLIAGMSNVDRKAFGKVGLRTFIYYLVTTVTAVFTGISLAVLIKPGKSSRRASAPSAGRKEPLQSVDAFLDLIRFCFVLFCFVLFCFVFSIFEKESPSHLFISCRNMIPSNLVEACFRKVRRF
ncbi:PREDICTED: excitatory amino acid transporter 4-like [Poecilia mexicana]|uniref:excitatory amino acid transporter 4-like n=1 Tax=Poecilia mexicana TaxID=48701 RepID=UPI00072DD152|nr:PREDICTED: excitatory amino acid transporter 4-like [Poecilia mexicana]